MSEEQLKQTVRGIVPLRATFAGTKPGLHEVHRGLSLMQLGSQSPDE